MGEFTYPSIGGPSFGHLDLHCIAFEKYDGSNLRFFWNRIRGWHSTGTRYRWFKPATPTFGAAVALFHEQYADGIIETMRRFKEYRGVNELVAFCEFFGPGTFSGLHDEKSEKQIVLFDLYLPGRDFVPPRDFVAHFGHLGTARVMYEGPFSRRFIESVQARGYSVSEGIVAKGTEQRRMRKGSAPEVWMEKVKTRAWLAELARRAADSPQLQLEYQQNLNEQNITERTDSQ